MRSDVVELLARLRASRRPELFELIAGAQLDGTDAPAAWPDVVEPYRWFLERLGDGVKLTGAGYLPPALVAETMQHLGWDADWIGKGNREDLTTPVAELRETARQLGLVRVHRGQLRVTTAGRRLSSDPAGLWQHIAARLPLGRGAAERQAGMLWLLAVAGGSPEADELVAQGLWALGWAEGRTGRPLDRHQAFAAYRDTWVVLDQLGVLGPRWRADRQPSSQAAIDLARTALLTPEQPPAPRRATAPVAALELEITVRDVEPRVWRRIVVPASISLRALHDVLQVTMGWENSHLYLFAIGDTDYGDVEDMDELGDVHTKLADLVAPGDTFRYDYDFGDGWEHDVRVLRTTTADGAHCLDGAGACPPEDCGGPGGYEHLLEVLADPAHPEHDELVEWIGRPVDPEAFDPEAVDAALRSRPRLGRG
jgi:hypothetical protein